MVIYDIKNNGYTFLVTCIDKGFVIIACTVGLIHREVCMIAVAPAVISVELLDRHKFYSIDS